jgi:chromosome condensin MukBEF complex kleisin-like MukF subunit
MYSFERAKTQELSDLKISNDVEFLKNELKKTEKLSPECAAESLWRTNKIAIITHRLKELNM